MSDTEVVLSSRLKLASKVTLKAMGQNEGGVLLKLDSGEMYTINDTTVAFLETLDGTVSLAESVDRLHVIFDVDRETLETDLKSIASELMDQNLVRSA
jgi:coenzyme PQQ synthesis protein D (PqqD)